MRWQICLILFFLSLNVILAQEICSSRIMGLRVYGKTEERPPIASINSDPITIEFDVNEDDPPDLQLRFYHCDRNWNKTQTSFVNDDLLNRIKAPIPYEPVPAGVEYYRFHYTLRLPGFAGVERFAQSGNYIFELRDEEDKDVLAMGRFFVVEKSVRPLMRVSNRYLQSEVNPYNLVNKIEVAFEIPEPDSERKEVLYPLLLTTVDVYRNRQLHDPRRIDVDDRDTHTFVDGFGTRDVRFVVDDVQPGNSYRRLDLRSIDDYPPGRTYRPRRGADVSRFLKPPARDSFGGSSIIREGRYADYMQFQFELVWDSKQPESIHVVGDFNGWHPSSASLMQYDRESKRYTWATWLRRGAYDYQYVRDMDDWTTLEGNDWRTVNLYSAFIYYRDTRFGGFDRIVGSVQAISNGANTATSP